MKNKKTEKVNGMDVQKGIRDIIEESHDRDLPGDMLSQAAKRIQNWLNHPGMEVDAIQSEIQLAIDQDPGTFVEVAAGRIAELYRIERLRRNPIGRTEGVGLEKLQQMVDANEKSMESVAMDEYQRGLTNGLRMAIHTACQREGTPDFV